MKVVEMRQTTLPEQTAKLIELGFEKPKNTQYVQRTKARNLHSPFIEFGEPEFEGSYTIGELIEMFDKYQDKLSIVKIGYSWFVNYHTKNIELIDALYDIIVKLKEEGVI